MLRCSTSSERRGRAAVTEELTSWRSLRGPGSGTRLGQREQQQQQAGRQAGRETRGGGGGGGGGGGVQSWGGGGENMSAGGQKLVRRAEATLSQR